ncbi:organic cation transporter protein-like [Battus philenor]|uniref:organic cation transporter protein-like n=1 Tax=Battus philenor TaxID=42288 RepID=UPI0035CF8D53
MDERTPSPQDGDTGDMRHDVERDGERSPGDPERDSGTGKTSSATGKTSSVTSTPTSTGAGGTKLMTGQDALESALNLLGPFGPYQRYVLVLLCIPNLLSAMYSLNYIFVADAVSFRCLVPECEGSGGSFHNTSVLELLGTNPCRRYEPLSEDLTCSRDQFHENHTIECNAFVYEDYNTVYSEFGLACREWLRTLVGSVRNAALPLALLLAGYVSDRWGRLTAFCVFSTCAGVLGLVKSFSINYNMYLTLEFLEAALGYGFGSAVYVMVVELARPSLRAPFACATGVAYGAGGALFALIAWKLPYWRSLIRAAYTPALLLPLYWYLMDESPRWLLSASRSEEAAQVLRKAARWNKVKIDEDILKYVAADEKQQLTVKKVRSTSWLELVRSRQLVARLAVCGWCWAAAAFVYYGLTINVVALSGNKHANFALNMGMEIVASILIMMSLERFGRKKSIFASFLLCGSATIAPFFISHPTVNLGLYFVGKLGVTAALNSLYVFTTELFPTAVRGRALAASSLLGRIGSVLAPQTPLLSKTVQAILYGASSLSAALALLAVPETRREPLPY